MNRWAMRFWGLVTKAMPTLGRDSRARVRNPLWHFFFSLMDDAGGCGCWRVNGRAHRWSR